MLRRFFRTARPADDEPDELDRLLAEVEAEDAAVRTEVLRDVRDSAADRQAAEVVRLLDLGARDADITLREVVLSEATVLLTRMEEWSPQELEPVVRCIIDLVERNGSEPWLARATSTVVLGLEEVFATRALPASLVDAVTALRDELRNPDLHDSTQALAGVLDRILSSASAG